MSQVAQSRQQTNAFVYKWTQISTGKWYIGSHSRKGSNPNDGYICSSKIVKPLILKNSKDWIREIIFLGEPKEVRQYETKLLVECDAAHDVMSFNQHNSDGKFSTIGKKPWNKGKKNPQGSPWNKGLPSELQPFYGKIASTETRKLLSDQKKGSKNPQFGKPTWNSGLVLGPQSIELIEKRIAPLRGRKRPPEVGRKVSETKRKHNLNKPKQSWEEMFGIENAKQRREQIKNQQRDSNGRLLRINQ
jgi:hypothetical protein